LDHQLPHLGAQQLHQDKMLAELITMQAVEVQVLLEVGLTELVLVVQVAEEMAQVAV
jgi:hypothetical protein